eukprot:2263040-Pyramimonas_sp.AAC.1
MATNQVWSLQVPALSIAIFVFHCSSQHGHAAVLSFDFLSLHTPEPLSRHDTYISCAFVCCCNRATRSRCGTCGWRTTGRTTIRQRQRRPPLSPYTKKSIPSP